MRMHPGKKLLWLLAFTYNSANAQNVQTATNGLYHNPASGTAVRVVGLGGELIQNTSIDLAANFSFQIKKNSDSYLSILNNGNIGIGIASPAYKLHFNSGAKISIGEADAAWVSDGVNLSTSQLKFRYNNAGGSWSVGIRPNGYSIETFDGNTGSINGSGIKTDKIIAKSFDSYNGFIVGKIYDGSLVLGGEHYPGTPLTVNAHTANTPGAYPAIYVKNSLPFDPSTTGKNMYNIHLTPNTGSSDGYATGISFGAIAGYEGQAQAGIYVQSGSTYGTKMFFGTTNTFSVGSQIRMMIDHTGKVGIGTSNLTDNDYKLFVETGIRTRKIKVDLATWPDYVFETSYQLPSLSHIEQYIKQYKHLPQVPAAAEIENNGLDIGEMQALQMKKIEELTLYIIELEKALKGLERKLQKLETIQN